MAPLVRAERTLPLRVDCVMAQPRELAALDRMPARIFRPVRARARAARPASSYQVASCPCRSTAPARAGDRAAGGVIPRSCARSSVAAARYSSRMAWTCRGRAGRRHRRRARRLGKCRRASPIRRARRRARPRGGGRGTVGQGLGLRQQRPGPEARASRAGPVPGGRGRKDVEHREAVDPIGMVERHPVGDAAAAIMAGDEKRAKPSAPSTATMSRAMARLA